MGDSLTDYMETVNRIEPDIHPLDQDGSHASIAISLKRIADGLDLLLKYLPIADAIIAGVIEDGECPPQVRETLERIRHGS